MGSVSVHSRIVLGESGARVENLDIRSNGYRNKKYLRRGISDYNVGKRIERKYNTLNYRTLDERRWYHMYYSMMDALRRWRYMNI